MSAPMANRNDGLEPGEVAFVERLARDLPGVSELLEAHRRDNDFAVLPYVFMGAYLWPWFLEHFRSKDARLRSAAIAYVDSLERELAAEDNATRNLIQIEFVEWLQNSDPALDDVRKALPPRLGRSVARGD